MNSNTITCKCLCVCVCLHVGVCMQACIVVSWVPVSAYQCVSFFFSFFFLLVWALIFATNL